MGYPRGWSQLAYEVTSDPSSTESRAIRRILPQLASVGKSAIELARSTGTPTSDIKNAIAKMEAFSLVESVPSTSTAPASARLYYLNEDGMEFQRAILGQLSSSS